jgi:hypothetical protein
MASKTYKTYTVTISTADMDAAAHDRWAGTPAPSGMVSRGTVPGSPELERWDVKTVSAESARTMVENEMWDGSKVIGVEQKTA